MKKTTTKSTRQLIFKSICCFVELHTDICCFSSSKLKSNVQRTNAPSHPLDFGLLCGCHGRTPFVFIGSKHTAQRARHTHTHTVSSDHGLDFDACAIRLLFLSFMFTHSIPLSNICDSYWKTQMGKNENSGGNHPLLFSIYSNCANARLFATSPCIGWTAKDSPSFNFICLWCCCTEHCAAPINGARRLTAAMKNEWMHWHAIPILPSARFCFS